MIHLNLSLIIDVHQSLHYNVSPLFEMAASLHALAQTSTSPPHKKWVEATLKRFRDEDMLEEWEYLSPIFAKAIPSFFAPHKSYHASGIEEQYNYLVELSNEEFSQSLAEVFTHSQEETSVTLPLVQTDFVNKPKIVKARFTLFLCTFMQFIFESKWEQVAPKLVRNLETKTLSLRSHQDLVAILRDMFPTVEYDGNTHFISLPISDNTIKMTSPLPITSLVFSPSWFIEQPSLEVISDKLYIIYGIAS